MIELPFPPSINIRKLCFSKSYPIICTLAGFQTFPGSNIEACWTIFVHGFLQRKILFFFSSPFFLKKQSAWKLGRNEFQLFLKSASKCDWPKRNLLFLHWTSSLQYLVQVIVLISSAVGYKEHALLVLFSS